MRKKQNKKVILIISIIIIILILILIVGLISGFDFNKLMGNSLTSTYYYCEDSTFTLKNQYCYKTNYTEPLLMGDVNKDGSISIVDVTEIQLYVSRNTGLDSDQIRLADVNGDGTVDNEDAVLLQRYIAGLSVQSGTSGGTVGASYKVGDKLCPKDYTLNSSKDSCSYKQRVKAKEASFIYGDVNLDGVVDEKDATLLQQYTVNLVTLNDVQKKVADVNKDGIINIVDVTEIQKMIVKENQNSITASLSLKSGIDVNNIVSNTQLEYIVNFNIVGNKTYYYKWFDVKSADNVAESECKKVSSNISDNYSITATNDNEYVVIKLYSDNACTQQFNAYKSDPIQLQEEKWEVSLNYSLTNPILTTNKVNKNTKLTFGTKFNVTGNKTFYYKWFAVKNGGTYNTPTCTKVVNGDTKSFDLTINGQNQHGVWNFYDDPSCRNVVKTYTTDDYNYIADSIKLNTNSTRLMVGKTVTLKATTSPSGLSGINWTSSNTAVATVNNSGVVTGKKAGTATITATIGGMSAKATVTVVEVGNDTSIACPLIEYDDDKKTMTISLGSSATKYDVYLSNSIYNGSYANWKLQGSNYTKNNPISYKNYTQAKIVVYGPSGTSRNCYSAFLKSDPHNGYTASAIASCPTISYSYQKSGNMYTYKDGSSTVTSGVQLLTVNANLNSNYQYSWYTSQKDGSYRPFKTYRTSTKSISPTLTGNYYKRNGLLVVTDKSGNIVHCYTKSINNYKFTKYTYGTTDVYVESGYSSDNATKAKNKVSSFNSNNPQYLAVGKIFLLTNSSYNKVAPSGSCGFISNRYITMRDSYSGCDVVGSLTHELGHSIDYMNGYVTKKVNGTKYDIRDYAFSYNGKNTTISNYYNTYKNNSNKRNSYLRDYAYTNNEEFWAELFAYQEKGFKVDSTLKDIRTKALNKYNNLYKNNKSTWNSIKESYR